MKLGFNIRLADRADAGPGSAPRYEEIRSWALRAEAAGFDSIWLYDHLLYRGESDDTLGIWECWTMLSALAEATSDIDIGTLVISTPFRNPALLAKMAATLDEVSEGRFTLGLGAGWNKVEFDAFGMPWDRRVDRFEEALRIIVPLLVDGRVDFEGRYYSAPDCVITPRGPSPDGPPIMVGSRGNRMMRLCAQYADKWNTGYLGDPDTLNEPLKQFHAACDDVGRHPSALEISVLAVIHFAHLIDREPRLDEYLAGSPQQLAESLAGYAEQGVAEMMFEPFPYNDAAFERLVEAVDLYRAG